MPSSRDEFLSSILKRGKQWENLMATRVGRMGKIPGSIAEGADTERFIRGRGQKRLLMGGGGAMGVSIYRHSSARRGLRGRSSGGQGPMY